MQANQCQHGPCKNPIRAGQTHCHLHGGMSASELDTSLSRGAGSVTLGELDEIRERRRALRNGPEWRIATAAPRRFVGITAVDRAADSYARHLPIRGSDAKAVLEATRSVVGKANCEIPMVAASQRGSVRRVAAELSRRIDPSRVSVLSARGLVRRTAARSRMVNADVKHEVLVIDAGTQNEILIDPFIAAFAPVPKATASLPVSQSGMVSANVSPYVDGVWMGTRHEYQNNGFIEWRSLSEAKM